MTFPTHRSWVTQRMANRLPLWADARLDKYSFFQQYMNPYGSALENVYKQLTIGSKNQYAATSNLDEIDVVYKVHLPRNFNFSVDDRDPANPITNPPIVTAKLGINTISIPIAPNNDVETFWYDAFPTRTAREGTSVEVDTSILAPTAFKDLASATFNTFSIQGRICVTLAGATEFINLKRQLQRGFVKIEGVTRKGQQESERINFITNTTILSTKEWRRLTKVSVHGIFPLTATIKIEILPFNISEEIDPFNLYIDEVNESVLFTEVDCQDYIGTFLKHKIFAATNLALLQQGFTGFDSREEAELLNTVGQPIVCSDFALQPFQDKVFVLTNDKIYIYYNFIPYPDMKNLRGQTEDNLMVAETNKRGYLRGQMVKINTDRRFPVKRVLRNRWTLTKPSGSKVRLGLDGSEWPLGSSGWILNPFSDTFNFKKQKINYTPTEIGTYVLELETRYHDGRCDIDKHIFNVNAINASAAIVLPTEMKGADGIAFDSDQNLWLKKINPSTGIATAYKMNLFTDNMLVDFQRKIVYFHEIYDKVIIKTGSTP